CAAWWYAAINHSRMMDSPEFTSRSRSRRRACPSAIRLTASSSRVCSSAQDSRCSGAVQVFSRSEEHTSELQSRENLVCRLLLEWSGAHRDLYSFPTRRSSDLMRGLVVRSHQPLANDGQP